MLDARIDQGTGELGIGEQRLPPGMNEKAFVMSRFGSRAVRLTRSGTRSYYEAWTELASGMRLGLTLGFVHGGRLERLSIKFVRPEYLVTKWSRELEDATKQMHDQWLADQLGAPPYDFAWGTARSAIDQHWYSANIVITYVPERN